MIHILNNLEGTDIQIPTHQILVQSYWICLNLGVNGINGWNLKKYKTVAHLNMNLSGATFDRKFYQELFIVT